MYIARDVTPNSFGGCIEIDSFHRSRDAFGDDTSGDPWYKLQLVPRSTEQPYAAFFSISQAVYVCIDDLTKKDFASVERYRIRQVPKTLGTCCKFHPYYIV